MSAEIWQLYLLPVCNPGTAASGPTDPVIQPPVLHLANETATSDYRGKTSPALI